MRKTLTAAAALAALAFAAQPASADFSPTRASHGGCAITTTKPFATFTAADDLEAPAFEMDMQYVVYSDTNPGDNPVSATVTCTLLNWGEPIATLTASGTTVVADAGVFPMPDEPFGYLEMCALVEYDNGEAEPLECVHGDPFQPFWTLHDVADPAVCPALRALAPGAGPVEVNEYGDVLVAGRLLWYCMAG